MADAVKNTTKVAVELEVTEGTYVAPSGAGSFLQTLDSGFEMNPSKELLERNIFTGSIGKVTPRTGTKSVSGAVPVECRAFSVEGSAPEYDKLMQSAFGTKRQNTTLVTSKATGNTSSILQIQDADIAKFAIGDIVLVKQAGAFHVSPITARSTTATAASITLLVPHPAGAMSASVTLAKFTTYTVAQSGHPSLSITKYVEDAIRQTAIGCRVNKFSVQNLATGKIPTINFGFDGLDFARTLAAPAFTPSYDSAYPPIALDARVYMDGSAITINELSVEMENSVGFKTSLSAANGKVSSRVTNRKISGSINPYVDTVSIANYTKFLANTEFSLFAYAKNDSGVTGEFQNIIAVYLPKCLITEVGEADADGILQETLSFQATTGPAGATNEIYFSVI